MPVFIDGINISRDKDNWSATLLSNKSLHGRSKIFSMMPCRKFSQNDNVLYINQREYGIVSQEDRVVKFIGSEDATTCHIVVMKTSYAVGLGHFDGADTKQGLISMAEHVSKKQGSDDVTPKSDPIEVHIIGGFCDEQGTSEELLIEILDTLSQFCANFNLMTSCVHHVNNKISNSKNEPIICGVAVEISTGDMFPAMFSYKGPNEILRHARIFGGECNMANVYDTINNTFVVNPFLYKTPPHARLFLSLSDDQILEYLSTSPHCEPDDFASTTRKTLQFLIENPDAQRIFKDWQPLIFRMNADGIWV